MVDEHHFALCTLLSLCLSGLREAGGFGVSSLVGRWEKDTGADASSGQVDIL